MRGQFRWNTLLTLITLLRVVLLLVSGMMIKPAMADEGSGDFGNDCTVDLDDFASFQPCVTGPGGGLPESECWRADFDGDGDIDLEDFAGFQVAFEGSFAEETGACCLPDDSCQQLTCSACVAAGGLFVAPGAVSCDIAVCCHADLRTDSDNDGDIDDDDEAIEDDPPGRIFVVNSDDDNGNGIPDMDESPVVGEDDLAEIQLSSSCDPTDPGSAWWSLSWPVADPPLLQIWENDDKSSGPIGSPIANDVAYPWPPPATLWLEAMETFELDLTFTISVDETRAKKTDKVKTKVSCTPAYKYAHVTESASATGCKAKVRTRNTTLCGDPNGKFHAHSAAYVGVSKYVGQTTEKWAQTGYIRRREAPNYSVFFKRYAETKAGSQSADYDLHFGPAPDSGNPMYECRLLSLTGTWFYDYDGLPWYSFSRPGWTNETGTAYQWVAEIYNKEDQIVGTAAAKCDFSECQYRVGAGGFQNANITSGDLHTDDASEWGIERVSATAFNVWDKNP